MGPVFSVFAYFVCDCAESGDYKCFQNRLGGPGVTEKIRQCCSSNKVEATCMHVHVWLLIHESDSCTGYRVWCKVFISISISMVYC